MWFRNNSTFNAHIAASIVWRMVEIDDASIDLSEEYITLKGIYAFKWKRANSKA